MVGKCTAILSAVIVKSNIASESIRSFFIIRQEIIHNFNTLAMTPFEQFSQLHQNDEPLLLGNIWDVNSARIFESNGFKAIGTSSQAVAKVFGYDDGENIPFETLLQFVKRVLEVVRIPVTVDIEGGFDRNADRIIDNISKLHHLGISGINLEDTTPGSTRKLQPVDDFQKLLSRVSSELSRKNVKVFINVRTDGFLLSMPGALAETLTRIKAYENVGANGIFVPCITDTEDIRKVVTATRLPINVMCMPKLPDFKELQSLGVKRISMGPFAYNYANQKTESAIKTVLQEGSFSVLFK